MLRTAACSATREPYTARITSLAAPVAPRVLVEVRGSGNHGESGPAAFYTIDKLPRPLVDMSPPEQPLQRIDLDLGPGRLAFYVDDALSTAEADALAACSEAILQVSGDSRMAPGIQTPPGLRLNEAAHWFPSQSAAAQFFTPLYERLRHLVPTTLGGLPLHGALSQKIAGFKYSDGDRFNPHTDGFFPGQGCNAAGDGVEQWPGVQSGMSILLYLNDAESDGLVGGETRLWHADGVRTVDVRPRKGRALFFRHGSGPDSVYHAGLPVAGAVPKHVARVNLAFGARRGGSRLLY